ncbi:hypothetical protein [Winogradskyella sp. A3E31]|uniref:hypothetical protein n=1 Tax=Winogradskyella sp. A3E31 TaxID=3349637 RepID=UPI00398B681F
MSKLRNIGLFLFIAAIVLTIFDGRMSSKNALDKSISEFNAKVELTNVTYIPEYYTERITDTILSNGYKVKIKTTTDMLSHIEVETNQDNTINKEIYRQHIVEIELQHEKTGTVRHILDQNMVSNSLDNLVLRAAYINEEASLFEEGIHLNLHFLNPNSKKENIFNMIIDNNGNYKITPQNART